MSEELCLSKEPCYLSLIPHILSQEPSCKRALYSLKQARYSLIKALHTVNRAMPCVIRTLYSVKRAPYTSLSGWLTHQKNVITRKRDSHVPVLCMSVPTLAKNIYNVSAFVFFLTICRSKERQIMDRMWALVGYNEKKHTTFCVGALVARVNKDIHRCVGPCGFSLFLKYYKVFPGHLLQKKACLDSKRVISNLISLYQESPTLHLSCLSEKPNIPCVCPSIKRVYIYLLCIF